MTRPTPPRHLPVDVAAIWVELTTGYGDGVERIHGPDFDAYCGQVSRLRDAQRRIHEEQIIVPDSKNQPVEHPALRIERAAQDEIRKWADRFKPRRRPGVR